MHQVVQELVNTLQHFTMIPICTHSKVYEDNNGALTLANVPRMTLCSNHIAVKYHFFREHVEKDEIRVLPIASAKQRADLFTKGLVKEIFLRLRKLLCGW